ncbi:hypothetical protein [Micromonospora echinofusca]|uniref:hypothetical protein n=1 Tax=Micromonospora echinofusca TaxID=47858 RepID=UPI0012FDB7A9|nr:hypothetical protein [Micromonospora echinofusca]
MPDTAVNIGYRRSAAALSRVAQASTTSRHQDQGPRLNPIPKLTVTKTGGSAWVTNWVTMGTSNAGRPRTAVDRSGSSALLLAQLIDG